MLTIVTWSFMWYADAQRLQTTQVGLGQVIARSRTVFPCFDFWPIPQCWGKNMFGQSPAPAAPGCWKWTAPGVPCARTFYGAGADLHQVRLRVEWVKVTSPVELQFVRLIRQVAPTTALFGDVHRCEGPKMNTTDHNSYIIHVMDVFENRAPEVLRSLCWENGDSWDSGDDDLPSLSGLVRASPKCPTRCAARSLSSWVPRISGLAPAAKSCCNRTYAFILDVLRHISFGI